MVGQWIVDSFLTPFMGAAIALITSLVIRGGFTIQTGVASTQSVNWMGIYAAAGLAGLFSPEAVKRMSIIFEAIFAADPTPRPEPTAQSERRQSPMDASNRDTPVQHD